MFDGTLAGPSSNAAGLPEPVVVNSVQQKPLEGVSMAYSFDDAQAAGRCYTQ
jgi:arylsulfatase